MWLIKWKKVKPITDIEEEPSCFEEEQMAAIVFKAKNQMHRSLYALAAGTGARAAELFALRCEDLNLQQGDGTGMMTIRRTVFEGQEFTTKSNKVRHVPIDSSIVDVLKEHLNGRKHGYVFQTHPTVRLCARAISCRTFTTCWMSLELPVRAFMHSGTGGVLS